MIEKRSDSNGPHPESGCRVEVPPIQFTEWVLWDKRTDLVTGEPTIGVYMWAHSHDVGGPGRGRYPDPPSEIIYVGETKNLNVRALGRDHHRLRHYGQTFPDDRDRFHRLWGSVFRVERLVDGDERCRVLRAFTRFVEDQIYWAYVQKWRRRAALDYKMKPGESFVADCCRVRRPAARSLTPWRA